jgi:hypothetical protein
LNVREQKGVCYYWEPRVVPRRCLWVQTCLRATEPLKPSSKVEETVCAIKEKAKEVQVPPPPKKSLKQRFIDECVHYYHGFKLLVIDIKVSAKLLWRVLNGKQLTRREHKLVSSFTISLN